MILKKIQKKSIKFFFKIECFCLQLKLHGLGTHVGPGSTPIVVPTLPRLMSPSVMRIARYMKMVQFPAHPLTSIWAEGHYIYILMKLDLATG